MSRQNNTAVTVNAVTYPLHAFIDETPHAGIRTRTSVIQKLRLFPSSRDAARKYATMPTVHRVSIASFSCSAPMPATMKLEAPAATSTADNP